MNERAASVKEVHVEKNNPEKCLRHIFMLLWMFPYDVLHIPMAQIRTLSAPWSDSHR